MIILVESEKRLQDLVEVPEMAWEIVDLSEKPVTLIYDNPKGLPKEILAEDGSIGIRLVKDDYLKKLIGKLIAGKGKIKFPEEGIFISPDGMLGFIPRMRKNDKLLGCNMSFSRKAAYAINGFDEDYQLPAVGEDYDLAWRFRAAGYQLVSVRNLAVQYHLNHPEGYNQDYNLDLCRQKQAKNEFVCKNGLIKHTV